MEQKSATAGKPVTARKPEPVEKTGPRLRPADFFVVLLCLSGAVASFNLFRLDLFRTISSQNQKPVGTVTIRNNTVQRRHQDRVIWDRLFIGSQVYEGDMLRIAESSSMGFKRDEIEVEYINYQIRRIPPLAPDGTLQIDGNVIVTVGAESGNIILNGSRVEAGPGTVIKAESGEGGTKLQVLEGSRVRIIKDGETWERSAGETVGWDAAGSERIEPSAVVMHPRPNAHFVKNSAAPMDIGFAWNRQSLEPGQPLRLEIAEDRNFTRVVYLSDNVDDARHAALDDGSWYWRLSYRDTVLAGERFTIAEPEGEETPARRIEEILPEVAEETPPVPETPPEPEPAPPALLAAPGRLRPVRGYRVGIEQLRTGRKIDFGWSPVPGANNYIFTLYRQNAAGLRQILRRELGNRTAFILDDLTMLDRGTFIWQVEAVEGRGGAIRRRGRPAENLLVLDFPLPSAPTVQIEELPQEAETFYGN